MTETENTRDRDHGEVVRFLPERHFGFIKPDGESHDLFFHVSNVHEHPMIEVDERVSFATTTYKGRLKAERVERE